MKFLLIACLPAFAVVSPVVAMDVNEIVDSAERSFTQTSVYTVSEMTSYVGDRERRSFSLESYTLIADGVTRWLTVFNEPPRMRGTAYLSVGEDVWVRFGSTGRVRKLTSAGRRESAGGTDFSYADLGEGGGGGISADYFLRLIDDRSRRDGVPSYEIELTPKPGSPAAYEKLVAYVSHDDFRYLAVEYFDSGAHTKTLTLSDYRTVDGVDYPFLVTMRNLARDTHTEIIMRSIEFDTDRIRESMFSEEYLNQME
ncbi:MAG: outer membrane lipoprotein-sorting protein [Spirochaetia bacterium]